MKLTLHFLLIALLLTLIPARSESEDTPVMIGIFGAGTYNMHRGTFTTYDGILDCGYFKDANSLGFFLGNYADLPLSKDIGLSFRVYFYKGDGDFKSENANPPRISLDDGTLIPLETEQTLATRLDYLHIDLLGKYFFLPNYYAGVGPTLGFNTHATYSQEESILSPAGVTFVNGGRTRRILSGDFNDEANGSKTALRFGLHFVAGADYKIAERIYLNPEVGFVLPFTKVLDNSDWTLTTLHAGVGLKYALGAPAEKVIETPAKVPEQPKPSPVVFLKAKNVLKDGTKLDLAQIKITEQKTSEILPLLPYVFFSPSESSIPGRYKQLTAEETAGFDEPELRDSVLGIYHHLLNIIGQRMQIYPNSNITVTGCVEPLEDTTNLQNLAQDRAASIKNYLVSVWKINPDRIKLNTRELPEKISNRQDRDGREENRRAEIASDDARVLAPVRISSQKLDFVPEQISLEPDIQFPETIASWGVNIDDIYQKSLWSKAGDGLPDKSILWTPEKKPVVIQARREIPSNYLLATFNVTTESGGKIFTSSQIPLIYEKTAQLSAGQISRDSVIERYNLIFFDFDKTEVSDFNKSVLKTIHQRIRTNSKVAIMGYTDRMGTEKYNEDLSRRRALAFENSIRSRIVPDQIYSTGMGETLIYYNDLPEGRFYNRTVIVEITSPLND